MARYLLLQIGQARPQLRGQRPCSALQNLRGLVTVLQHPSAFSAPKFLFFFLFFFSRFSRKEVSAHHWVRLAGVLAKSFDPLC